MQDKRFNVLRKYALSETLGERIETPKGRTVSLHELNVHFLDGDKKWFPILKHSSTSMEKRK